MDGQCLEDTKLHFNDTKHCSFHPESRAFFFYIKFDKSITDKGRDGPTKGHTHQPTDGQIDGWTDKVFYRDITTTHLNDAMTKMKTASSAGKNLIQPYAFKWCSWRSFPAHQRHTDWHENEMIKFVISRAFDRYHFLQSTLITLSFIRSSAFKRCSWRPIPAHLDMLIGITMV